MQNYPFSLSCGGFIFHKKNTPNVKDEIRDNLKASLSLTIQCDIYIKILKYRDLLIPINTQESTVYKWRCDRLLQIFF